MLAITILLRYISGEAWVSNFVKGLTPAVAVLMVTVAWQIFRGERDAPISLFAIIVGALSLVALLLKAPAPLVLLAAGLSGVIILR